MVRDYELMYVVRPEVDDDGLQQTMADVQRLVKAQGGEVAATTSWGKRRLAYEIERMRDGHYVILHVRLEPGRVVDLERVLHINDAVFRHLVTVWVPGDEAAAPAAPDEPRATAPADLAATRDNEPAEETDDDLGADALNSDMEDV